MNFTITIDNIIGFIALLTAISSFIYTWKFNHYSIDLTNVEKSEMYEQIRLEFSVVNLSPKPLQVTDVKLISITGNLIEDNKFSPVKHEKYENSVKAREWKEQHANDFFPGLNPYTSPFKNTNTYLDESSPFETAFYLSSQETEDLSYFVNEFPAKVIITTDKKIYHFGNSQSFTINLD